MAGLWDLLRAVRRTGALITCTVAAALLAGASGCAVEPPENDTSPRAGFAAGAFSGKLVVLDGDGVVAIDGSSAQATDIASFGGEIGWSGFVGIAEDGFLVFQHLSDDGLTLRSLDLATGEERLLAECDGFYDFAGRTILAEKEGVMVLVPTDGSGGVSTDLSGVDEAILSIDGTEFAYVTDTTTAETDAVEGQPTLTVGSIRDSDPGLEITRPKPIAPLLLTSDTLVYAEYEFGGSDLAEVHLVDRRSSETTLVASGVSILDVDRESQHIACASRGDGTDASGSVLIIGVSGPDSVTTAVFPSPDPNTLTTARLSSDGAILWAAFAYPDGATTVEQYEATTGKARTVAEIRDRYVSELLPHPLEQIAFLVVEDGTSGTPVATRELTLVDGATGTIASMLASSSRGLLTLVGVVP